MSNLVTAPCATNDSITIASCNTENTFNLFGVGVIGIIATITIAHLTGDTGIIPMRCSTGLSGAIAIAGNLLINAINGNTGMLSRLPCITDNAIVEAIIGNTVSTK